MSTRTTHDAVSKMAPAFATFRAKLLDPRPLAELMTADIRKDMAKAWRKGMRDLDYAKHGHFYEAIGFDTGIVGHTRAVRDQMWANYQAAMAEQALIPAPTATELRWKMRLMKHIRERADVTAAIAADEARLSSIAGA